MENEPEGKPVGYICLNQGKDNRNGENRAYSIDILKSDLTGPKNLVNKKCKDDLEDSDPNDLAN
jgi:hypothetical protein